MEISKASMIMSSILLMFSTTYFLTPINILAMLVTLEPDLVTCLGNSSSTLIHKGSSNSGFEVREVVTTQFDYLIFIVVN
jgi:hypothetical protein